VPSDNPYERRVSKRYRASNGDTRTVYGTFRFEDYDATMEAMKRREIQSLDPRIEWDEELGPQIHAVVDRARAGGIAGDWEYEDFSFQWEPDDAGFEEEGMTGIDRSPSDESERGSSPQ